MTKNVSLPRSPTGSSFARRHPSPTHTDRYPVIYSSHQRLPDRPNIPPIAAVSSPSVTSSIYSNTSSPISPGPTYPSILNHDRPPYQPPHSSFAQPAMAPSTAMARGTPSLGFDLAPVSTPTGRISKAKKGKRVHACEFPGCGKVFTRAEHKRRHELNHNPDATFQCNHPGCNKSFHRNDLLQRHQERHDLEASNMSPIQRRHPSQSTPYTEPPMSMPVSSMASPQVTESTPRTSVGGMTISSLVHPPTSNYATTDMSNPFGIHGVGPYLPWSTADDGQIYYSSDSSPMLERSRTSSVTGFDMAGSVSPMVTASMPSNWMPASAPPTNLPPSMFGEDYASVSFELRYLVFPLLRADQSPTANPMPIPLSDLDGYEWAFIRRELSTVPGLLSSPGRVGLCDDIRWDCLELYWTCFHPTLPIVHRPTFLPTQPSPLLACAIIAIGSFYDEGGDSKIYSLALLEIAIKILRRRPNITSRSRIVDLQTVVLLEILSTFCARQISVQMSTRFRSLFANLNQSHHWLTTSPLAVFRTLRPDRTAADLSKAHKFFVEHETRSRILHACSIIDSQQALLFNQPHTIRRQNGLRINTGGAPNTANNLHLPCDDDLWDASPLEKWSSLAACHEYRKIPAGRPTSPKTAKSFSFFQQQVICSTTDEASLRTASSLRSKSALSLVNGQAQTTFNYHMTEMCRHLPIKGLLIVTGESWLLGRKIEKEAEFSAARADLRKWLDATTTAKRGTGDSITAHWHALKLLRCLTVIRNNNDFSQGEVFGTTNMMHENWVIYLACLVCWAHGYRKMSAILGSTPVLGAKPNGIMASPINGNVGYATPTRPSTLGDPLHAAVEAQTYLTFTDVSSPTALRDLDAGTLGRTQGLLETVRSQKVNKCLMGGLMNDASQVLFKLAEGQARVSF